MGWADCGTDSNGRPIGYGHEATCDHPGCDVKIDRGLSYACGGMHGDCGGQACEGYFCTEHLHLVDKEAMGFTELDQGQLCTTCLESARKEIADMVINGDIRAISSEDVVALTTAQARIERLEGVLKWLVKEVSEDSLYEDGLGALLGDDLAGEIRAALKDETS